MRKTLSFALGLAVLVLPAAAFAQTASAQYAATLAQITQLEQEIQALTGNSSNTSNASTPAYVSPSQPAQPTNTSSNTSSNTAVCPDLTQNLSLGSSGSDVANLQAFLAGQGLFSAGITAYFGTITQSAVQEWQSSHGVVPGGTPATTGFGVVGAKTRAAIAAACGYTPQTASCIASQPPAAECSTGWKPVTDASGCTTYYQCAIPLPGTATSTATSTSSTSCPVVQKPACNGSVMPFQSDANGCVLSYKCVL